MTSSDVTVTGTAVRVERERTLELGRKLRDLAFWDDETLIVGMETGELWRHPLVDGEPPKRLFRGASILGPVAKKLGTRVTEADVTLAVSKTAGVAMVCTHDHVVVACPLDGSGEPRLVSFYWGEYDPDMDFSPDGSRFRLEGDTTTVYDTTVWRWHTLPDTGRISTWLPGDRRLLTLQASTGELLGWDFRELDEPRSRVVGTIDAVAWEDHASGMAVSPAGDQLVVAYRLPDRLEWWQLDPLRRLDTQPLDGVPYAIVTGRGGDAFAVESDRGVRVWSFARRQPVSEWIPETYDVRFAPSGTRFATLSRIHVDPRKRSRYAPRWAVLWRVEVGVPS